MRFFTISICLFFFINITTAQTGILTGKITDAETGEVLIGANIVVGTVGTSTDIEGNYTIELTEGKQTLTFSYVGYEASTKTINIKSGNQTLDVALKGDLSFKEVILTADIAIDRKTPVAFSNITSKKLAEELASQDLPMILNSTPGVYATNTGGGDGDARINIRGFDQRNIAVMLDGVPVNDMENGWVYWSNWFGLDLITNTMQVQRGLGASKLAIPSVGGTINILTQGINSRKGIRVRQEIGTGQYTRTTLGLTSGRLDNGWGVAIAGSYKQGNGWVEGTFTKGYFYYLKVDKEIGNHLISFSGFGAPQEHGQRPFKDAIGVFDTTLALQHINQEGYIDDLKASNPIVNRGRRFNENLGYLDGKTYNTRQNFYHKPQFSLRHFWDNRRTSVSNVAYVSVGKGGGLAPYSTSGVPRTADGRMDLDQMYLLNNTPLFGRPNAVSSNFMRGSMNEHYWYGLLSTVRTELSEELTLSGGVDFRYYEGSHYRQVLDLFGGDYYIKNEMPRVVGGEANIVEGDRYDYDFKGLMRWGGGFGLLEYNKDKLSVFVNVSAATIGYSMEDYWKAKMLNLPDTTIYFDADAPDYTDENGNTYNFNSEEVVNQKLDWKYRQSFSIKLGASYNFTDNHTAFINTGYLSRPTRFNNIIQSNFFAYNLPIQFVEDPENEVIYAVEGGYQYRSQNFSMNFNAYWTNWLNKPLDRLPTIPDPNNPDDPQADRIPINVNGLSALHKGIEIDFAYKLGKKLNVQGLVSLGDWIWNSAASYVLPGGVTDSFDPKGVHVGDAAQTQLGGMVQYRPFEGAYLKMRGTYFGRNYALMKIVLHMYF